MRKKEEREKEFQRFVDVGGLKFLEETKIKKAESKRDKERKRQEGEEFMELVGYFLFCALAILLMVGTYWFFLSEFGKRMVEETVNSIMKGRY
ncbi:hypothetical protein [Enterococcus termitis]|uniref:Uncharacterized protein n=1 Tax=Enterococcus termitis TaxID=332950 RepID=A0A1E5GVS3_9ENTE|nr:hypothetical protein [Enterococcus termitis]OEG16814.1 hypothetical protein BCR25_04245 [Enterococcus termitis]OJG99526.1 hypothetical protein RV18_GL001594 [Enterococcus termitis]